MSDGSTDKSKPPPFSVIVPGPAYLRQCPAYDLVAWQPQGVLDNLLLEQIGEWLFTIDQGLQAPARRYVDLSHLTNVAVRTSHVFEFAQKRAEQFDGVTPVRSALFSEDWVTFGIAVLYENLMNGTPIEARAFHDRAKAAVWLNVPTEILTLEDTPSSLDS